MNSKLLTSISFLIALLCHLIIFNLFTVVFPIDPAAFKPKFFFLGPMLKQSDVKQIPSKENTLQSHIASNNFSSAESNIKNMHYKEANQAKNPFAIRTIEKPLTPQATKPKKKIILKSTFETSPKNNDNEATKIQNQGKELIIQPYQSLQLQSR